MKFFRQLIVAPAILGVLSTFPASANESNIDEMSNYSNSPREIQSLSDFGDIYPSDWAHKALVKMVNDHNCPVSQPNGAITRYEAAALINRCLENVVQVNSQEQLLLNQFRSELAVIQGRIDSAQIGPRSYEAGLFSTTTKLSGRTTFVVGAINGVEALSHKNPNVTYPHSGEATTFTYDQKFDLDTSFNGDDLLKTSIRAGNIGDSDPFGCSGLAALEVCNDSGGNYKVDRLYYQFPLGEDFQVTVGPQVRQDDMLGVWPSAYPSDSILDVTTYAGANAAYGLAFGAGAGVTYAKGNLSSSLLFVSEEANNADASSGGVLSDGGSDDYSAQIAWSSNGLTLAGIYTVADNGNTTGTADSDDYSAYGISGIYQPEDSSGVVPSAISVGMGWKSPDNESDSSDIEDESTWTVGLLWDDVGFEGNTLGLAVGTAEGHRDDSGYDDPLAYEVFYSMALSDYITVTPALFQVEKDGSDAITGGLVKTTFNF